ncbi:14347_t:CDS:2 [Acaulospora colombiana]|uniref:14347_t:CDS:1 n=1 Tax=Acaulospora colombiana TaxID=27376 RepID=A0ACA9KQV1_9GLOM|nr:14347_t:CDS:2 [Acaulospora colombiana]
MDQFDEEKEHSIEMHLPYIYKILEKKIDSIKIVPVLVGSLSPSDEVLYGKLFSPYLADPSNLFVISSDFYSPGTSFNLNRKSNMPLTIPIHRSIENLDREGMTIIERINHKEFVSYLSKTRNTICGRHPIGVLLCAIEALPSEPEEIDVEDGTTSSAFDRIKPRIRFVHYAQSSRVTRENDSSVSYASAYVYLP